MVGYFTKVSQRKLRKELGQLDSSKPFLFVTLTYPKRFPKEGRLVESHRKSITESIKRRYPTAATYWKKEFQYRGAPHFLLYVFGPTLEQLSSWLPSTWSSLVRGGPFHRRFGVSIQWRRDHHACLHYFEKSFTTTPPPYFTDVGRFWGCVGKENLALYRSLEKVVPIDKPTYNKIRRAFRKYLKGKNPGRYAGMRATGYLICQDPEAWARLAAYYATPARLYTLPLTYRRRILEQKARPRGP